MADKLMYILNNDTKKITPSVDYNKWLKRFNTQHNEPTNQNQIKVPKVVKPTISYHKTAQCPLPLCIIFLIIRLITSWIS